MGGRTERNASRPGGVTCESLHRRILRGENAGDSEHRTVEGRLQSTEQGYGDAARSRGLRVTLG